MPIRRSKSKSASTKTRKAASKKTAAAAKPAARVEAQTVAPYGSDEYFAAWDAADAAELAFAVAAWGTGDGTAESPWRPIPDAEMIARIRQHEADGQNRPEVLAAIDAKVAEPAEEPPAAKAKARGKHATKVIAEAEQAFENLYGGSFLAKCVCGWSERRSTKARADQSAAAHEANAEPGA